MKSMTGFGRAKLVLDQDARKYTVDVTSVNRKFLDLRISLPSDLAFAETAIRQRVSEKILRGNVSIRIEPLNDVVSNARNYTLNMDLLHAMIEALPKVEIQIREKTECAPVSAATLFAIPGVIREVPLPSIDMSTAETAIQLAVDEALTAFDQMRQKEGESLQNYFCDRLNALSEMIVQIKNNLREIQIMMRQKIMDRIQNLNVSVAFDPARLEQEIFFHIQKADVTEELVRLESHIAQFREIVNQPHCGRKLDFLTQEMQREITTLGNKTGHVEVMGLVVDFKTEIERMKEQVQNVE